MNNTRNGGKLFFAVETPDTEIEIFETVEDMKVYILDSGIADDWTIWISIVRNCYQEQDGSWNYDDYSETFSHMQKMTKEDFFDDEFLTPNT